MASLGWAGSASAQVPGSNANATALRIDGGRTVPADCPPGGGGTAPGQTAGLVTVGVLNASCTETSAQASAASVNVGTLQLGLVQSQCTTGPTGTASSSVLVVNGAGGLVPTGLITNTVTVNLGIATVVLNEPISEPGFRGFNAVHITALGLDVIVAQSRCRTTAYPLNAALTAGADLGVQPLPVGDGGGAPMWLFGLAAGVLVVATGATLRPALLRRNHASDG
jgi:hypothetical protein